MNYKTSYQDSSGQTVLFPYYWDGQQIVEGNAPSWTSDIYYFGDDVVRRDYGGATPWLTVVFSGHSFWTPWYIPTPESEMPAPAPPPPITNDPCINISDFGIELRNESFTFSGEALNYINNPEVDKLASLEKFTSATLIESKNQTGRLHKFVCTNYYIDNITCWIQQVSYDMVPEYNLFIAKYYFPNGIPTTLQGSLYYDTKFRSIDGYYYVTTGGRICYIQEVTTSSPPPITLPPRPDLITPETPLIGAGSVYSSDIEGVSDYEITTKTIWSDGKVNLTEAYCHCDGSFGSTIDKDLLSFGFDVYNHPYNHPKKECIKKLFRVAYGNINGDDILKDGGKSMTKAIYSQYAQKLLGDPNAAFVFAEAGGPAPRILIIDFPIDLYKYELDPGNWMLVLNDLDTDDITTSDFYAGDFTPMPGVPFVECIDTATSIQVGDTDYSYDIVRGSLDSGISDPYKIGKIYPKHGVIVINLDDICNWYDGNANDYSFHAWKFFRLIQVRQSEEDLVAGIGGYISPLDEPVGMIVRKRDKEFTLNYFLRVKHYNFNLSNNPTFVNEDSTLLQFMINNPTTYVTSVGLYNEKKELLAVGKLPKPMRKDFNEETVINVKISQ